MKKLLLCLPVVAGSVFGCANNGDDGKIDTVFDPCEPLVLDAEDGTGDERASIEKATQLWNAVASTQLSAAPVDGAPRVPVFFDDAGDNFHGQYDDQAGVIYINNDIDSDHARAVTLAHEAGHAMGLLHVDVDEHVSVMNDGNLVTEPNDFDVAALQAIWGACGDS
jgi:hypothetical protein